MSGEYITEQIGTATVTRLAAVVRPGVPAVSMRQAKLALLAAGQLGAVEAAIEAMPEPARSAARIEWASTGMVERAHPTVALIGAAAGLTDEEVDSLFAAAALIV